MAMTVDAQQWQQSIGRELFVKTKSGKFARIQVEVYALPDGNSIHLSGFYNPSGSRNLESDPQKLIDPRRIAKVGLEKAIEEVKAKSAKQ